MPSYYRPRHALRLLIVRREDAEAFGAKAHDLAQPLGRGIKLPMGEEAAHEAGDFPFVEVGHERDGVAGMAKSRASEIAVAGDEGRALQAQQQRDEVGVADAFAGKMLADDPAADAPAPQLALFLGADVFVEDQHTEHISGEDGLRRPREPGHIGALGEERAGEMHRFGDGFTSDAAAP